MIHPKNIRVWTLSRDSVTLTWEIETTNEDLATYKLAVLRSDSEVGPYTQISQDLNAADVDQFIDIGANLHSRWREHHYRLALTKDGTTTTFGSRSYEDTLAGGDPGSVVMEALPDLEALEAIRRFDLTLKEYSGRKVLVLAQRSWGTRCTDCWDALKRRRNKTRCLNCYDTGISGGYFYPQECYAMKPPHQAQVQLTPLFELQVSDVVMWFGSRPRLKPRDLVIDTDGNRYRAIGVSRSEKGWALTRQTVQLRAITKDQVEYDLSIQGWGEDNFSSSPARQYIRATDIDSHREAARKLGLE
jgi:hypothetical protein